MPLGDLLLLDWSRQLRSPSAVLFVKGGESRGLSFCPLARSTPLKLLRSDTYDWTSTACRNRI